MLLIFLYVFTLMEIQAEDINSGGRA
jgi:hypothetical protein